jgi:hypothetical protein
VLEHEAHGLGLLGGEDRHRGAAAIQIASSAMMKWAQFFDRMAIACAGLEALRLQVRRHAPCLVERLCPGVVLHPAAAQGLRQVDGSACCASWS